MGIGDTDFYSGDLRPRTIGDIVPFPPMRVRHRIPAAVAVLMSTIWLCFGHSALAEPANVAASLAARAADQKASQIFIPVLLKAALDSKKRSTGDEVEAKTSAPVHLADGTLIPQGAKVIGHITEAKARSKGDTESSLGVVFDSITTRGGQKINIKAYPRAVAPNPNEGESDGGIGYGDLKQTVAHSQPGDQSQPVTVLDEQSLGVKGIKNLTLGNDGVLRSEGKSVKVEHGAQMMLRVN